MAESDSPHRQSLTERAVADYWLLLHRTDDLLQGGYCTPVPPCPPGAWERFRPQTESPAEVQTAIARCRLCPLRETASDPVGGYGPAGAALLVITDSPTKEDDEYGQIMFGEDGDYFEKWVQSIGLDKNKDCYFSSIVRCCTPGGRSPLKAEQTHCLPFLQREIKAVRPKILIALGAMVYSILTDNPAYAFDAALMPVCVATPETLRSHLTCYQGIPLVPIYHPKEVLAQPNLRRSVWDVMKRVRFLLNS